MASHYYNMLSKKTNSYSNSSEYIYKRVEEVKKAARATFLGLILCLSWNLISVTMLWLHNTIETKIVCLAIGYLLLGVPSAYATWHHELGLAFRGETGFHFHRFLVFYVFHIVFCLFASFDPFAEKSLAGFTSGMVVYGLDGLTIVGIMYFIGFLIFFFEYALSIWVLCNVHKLYLQGGFGLVDDDDDGLDLESVKGSII